LPSANTADFSEADHVHDALGQSASGQLDSINHGEGDKLHWPWLVHAAQLTDGSASTDRLEDARSRRFNVIIQRKSGNPILDDVMGWNLLPKQWRIKSIEEIRVRHANDEGLPSQGSRFTEIGEPSVESWNTIESIEYERIPAHFIRELEECTRRLRWFQWVPS
jgi:hypothetical protein